MKTIGLPSPSWMHQRCSLLSVFLLLLLAVSFSCSDDSPTEADEENGGNGGGDLPGAVTEEVSSAEGDTLTTDGGTVLVIGPNALPADTSVTLIPVSVEDDDDSQIAGARMEPDGLILDSAVVVKLPLPSDWDSDDTPLVYAFKGDDPDDAVLTHAYARVTGEQGAYFAEILISHFSGVVCAKNCHAGTMRHVLQKFQERGCSKDSILGRARKAYPGVNIPDDGCGARGVETVQAFLDTYFEDRGGWNEGQPLSAELISELTAYVQQGRQVVLAFKPGSWGSRSGGNNFLPTSALEYAHTAPLEWHEGQVQIKNTIVTNNSKLIQALGGENVARYPFSQVNDFRNLPAGVAVELATGGTPGCLSDPSLNPHGLDVYHPVEGQSYWGRAWSDPWTYLLSSGSWSGIPPRGIPYTAVRIYVERLDGPQSELCPEENDGEVTMSATVSIPGYTGPFTVLGALAVQSSLNGDPGYPSISGSSDPTYGTLSWNPYNIYSYDMLSIILNKGLSAPGTYSFTDEDFLSGDAVLFFTTHQIKHAGTNDVVVFGASSGTVTLEEYGTSIGSRIKGTITVNVYGERDTTPPGSEDPEEETIIGSINGSFDGVIADWAGKTARFPIQARRGE